MKTNTKYLLVYDTAILCHCVMISNFFGPYTKFIFLVDFQGSKELGLTVLDEEDNETLLVHNITSDDIYRKQEGD